ALVFCLLFVNQKAQAQQQNMWGSGFYQGGMQCPYQTTVAKNAVSMSDDEKEARQDLDKLKTQLKTKQTDRKRAESKIDFLRKKVERYFDSSVSEFLLDTHIEGAKMCKDYKSYANGCMKSTTPAAAAAPAPVAVNADGSAVAPPPAAAAPPPPVTPAVDCSALIDVPDLLAKKWNDKDGGRGNYCVGSSKGNAGNVTASICSDESLRPTEGARRSYNTSDCSKSLADYRKTRIDLANAADAEERLQDEIQDKEYAISDARDRANIDRQYRVKNETESDCQECDAYSRGYQYQQPKRDWMSTAVNVIGGLGLMYTGKQAEAAANENAAQLGYPSSNSYGFPYYQAGIAGVINGLAGPGAYGCSGGYNGQGPNGQFGVNGGLNSVMGPFGNTGGAFGYPQNMYNSPWGGGAYNPGLNMNGGFNGPFGGTGGGQFGVYPGNGSTAMCFTWPCNNGGNGLQLGANGGLNIGGQLGMGNQYGYNPYNPYGGQFGIGGNGQFGLGGQMSMQYQQQMQQMQMQMQMQQYQQQQQYYQAQQQAQMQYYQQQQQRQAQAMQIQQQIQQLNMQLQMIYQNNSYGLGGYGGLSGGLSGGISLGGTFGLGGSIGAPTPGGYTPNPYGGTIGSPYPVSGPGVISPTLPGTGGTTVRGR
ncbi:MAG: hypothetical protein ACXVAX_08120, partial [Pseudobdellovibrio sp.]